MLLSKRQFPFLINSNKLGSFVSRYEKYFCSSADQSVYNTYSMPELFCYLGTCYKHLLIMVSLCPSENPYEYLLFCTQVLKNHSVCKTQIISYYSLLTISFCTTFFLESTNSQMIYLWKCPTHLNKAQKYFKVINNNKRIVQRSFLNKQKPFFQGVRGMWIPLPLPATQLPHFPLKFLTLYLVEFSKITT